MNDRAESVLAHKSPEQEAEYRMEMAGTIQKAADAEVGKKTGEPEGPDTPKPRVWVVVNDDMKRVLRLTGKEAFKGASARARMYLEIAIPLIEKYIAAPHIVDSFTTHPTREQWGDDHIRPLGNDVLQYWKKNMFSMSTLTNIDSGLKAIARETADLDTAEAICVRELVASIGAPGGMPDIVGEFADKEIGDNNYKKYDRKTPEEKSVYANAFHQACKKLVEKIEAADRT